ncbi:MAG: PilZ domain-containing protein [Pyrinomonadaceae bacterium]
MTGQNKNLSSVLKAALAKLRPLVGERRRLPRYKTTRTARLFDATPELPGPGGRPLLPMVGYTRDLSETGLAIVVTSDSISGPQEELVGRELRIVLDLPDGLTHLRGTVVRGQPIEGERGGKAHLIGVRITQMNDQDWTDMVRYILNLQKRLS